MANCYFVRSAKNCFAVQIYEILLPRNNIYCLKHFDSINPTIHQGFADLITIIHVLYAVVKEAM